MSALKIHAVLRRVLKERGMTTTQLARTAGVPQSTLATWLVSGAKPKDPEQVAKVSRVLGISLHQLLFDEPEQAHPLTGIETEIVLDGFYRLRLERVVSPKK